MRFLNACSNLLWTWILPALLVGTAILCGIYQRLAPLSHLRQTWRVTYGSLFQRPYDKKQLQTVATALAATMGTGNLVGTAAAICTGGAGAVFWMFCSAMLGMVLVYAENIVGMHFRTRTPDGTWCGGAIACLRYGTKNTVLACFYAICCAAAGLGMGSMAQASAIASAAECIGIPRIYAGITACVLAALILHGGRERIGNVTIWLMPLICGLYLMGCTVLICRYASNLPHVFARILREAFGVRGAVGGFCGTMFLRSASVGLRRGIFSNEAGLGTSALLHMDAEEAAARQQCEWAAAEIFADTAVCCMATALAILVTPQISYSAQTDAASLLLHTFSCGLGRFAGAFLAVSLILLAFATLIGWYPCGEAAMLAVFPREFVDFYCILWILAAFWGALNPAALIFALCDCCNALMAVPNLYALIALRKNLKMEEVHENSGSEST